jgi:hypothetical protein
MACPICGVIAERIATTIEGVGIVCPMCRQFDIAISVIASGPLRGLALEERADVLGRARRSAEPGARPVITPYLLAQLVMTLPRLRERGADVFSALADRGLFWCASPARDGHFPVMSATRRKVRRY